MRLRELFRGLPDIERGLVRIHFGKATPLELVRVLQAFQRVADAFPSADAAAGLTAPLLQTIVKALPGANVETFLGELNTAEAKKGKKSDLFKESDQFEELQVSR